MAETIIAPPKSQESPVSGRRVIPWLLFEILLIGALFWGLFQLYNDFIWFIWSILVWLLYMAISFIRLLIYVRSRPRKRLDGIHVLVLLAVLVIAVAFFQPITLAREMVQYARYRSDFDVVASVAEGFCGLPDNHYAVDLMPYITEQHGWRRAQVVSDADGAHFIILFNRPNPTASHAVDGTAFVYAQQPQELNQRIDTEIGSFTCPHYLGDGWLVCLPST